MGNGSATMLWAEEEQHTAYQRRLQRLSTNKLIINIGDSGDMEYYSLAKDKKEGYAKFFEA